MNQEAQVFKDIAAVVIASAAEHGIKDIQFISTTFKEHEDGDFTFETWNMEDIEGDDIEQDEAFYKLSEELENFLWTRFDDLSAEDLQGYEMVFDIKKGRLHERY